MDNEFRIFLTIRSFIMSPNVAFLHYCYTFFIDKENCFIYIFNKINEETQTFLETNAPFLLLPLELVILHTLKDYIHF